MNNSITKNQFYIISGIEPSKKGAGKFIQYFLSIAWKCRQDINIIYNHTPSNPVIKLLKRTGLFNLSKQIFYLLKSTGSNLDHIDNSTVFLFHPQTLGLLNSSKLIRSNRKIYFYLLDNFFFCMKSHNYTQLKGFNSCIDCLTNEIRQSASDNGCSVQPIFYSVTLYLQFLDTLSNNLDKITFLAQNSNQKDLIIMKFGPDVQVDIIGMYTGEINFDDQLPEQQKDIDFLFHNTDKLQKGLAFFIDLAVKMPTKSFVVPYVRDVIKYNLKNTPLPDNLDYRPCTWETGLLNLMQHAQIVVNPSLWSASVEGALLKSLFYHGCVAVKPNQYSFTDELPDDIVIRLSNDQEKNVGLLNSFLDNKVEQESLRKKSRKWVQDYAVKTEETMVTYLKNVLNN